MTLSSPVSYTHLFFRFVVYFVFRGHFYWQWPDSGVTSPQKLAFMRLFMVSPERLRRKRRFLSQESALRSKRLFKIKVPSDQCQQLLLKGRGLFFLRLYSQQIIGGDIVELCQPYQHQQRGLRFSQLVIRIGGTVNTKGCLLYTSG